MLTVEEWNAQHPIGTLVLAWPGIRDDEPLVTMTRSAAWPLGHGAPVVAVEGHAGGIALTHVDPRRPRRLQRRRLAGWQNLSRAIYVGRPSRWGNPFQLGEESHGLVRYGPKHLERFGREWDYEGRISGPGSRHDMWFSDSDVVETHVRWATRAEIVELYRLTLTDPTPGMLAAYPSGRGRLAKVTVEDVRRELAGRDLTCWCPLVDDEGQPVPCHADVLLELANAAIPATAPEPAGGGS